MAKFTCKMAPKGARKMMAAAGAKAAGDAFSIADNEDGSFTVFGVDKAGNQVPIDGVATLTATSSDPSTLTLDTPSGATVQTHGVKPGAVTISVTATWDDGSVGPFSLDLTGTVGGSAVAGLTATFSNPVPRP